jgi:hypothetical protein
MASPPAEPERSETIHAHLDRILRSETFHKAESLRNLLQYLATEAAAGRSEHIKESVLAVDVFGRRADFDGRVDNIVRVQAHRLRKLLDGYYAREGLQDRMRFTIPKGSYVLQFAFLDEPAVSTGFGEGEPIQAGNGRPALDQVLAESPAIAGASRTSRRRLILPVAAAFVAGALSAVLVFGLGRFAPWSDRALTPAAANAMAGLWRGIFEPGSKVIISFTNPAFLRVGRSPVYLLYLGPLTAPAGAQVSIGSDDPYLEGAPRPKGEPLYFNAGWTGTGEVLAMNRLTTLSAAFHSSLVVVPSRSLALSEMRGANVIFLGSPWGNGELSKLGADAAPMYVNDHGAIMIRDDAGVERESYRSIKDAATQEITASFSLFSVLPGMEGGKIVSSAGLCTWATWAGVDFATTPSGVAQIEEALRLSNGGKLPAYYQAVIRTRIVNGIASGPSLVTTRTVKIPAERGG